MNHTVTLAGGLSRQWDRSPIENELERRAFCLKLAVEAERWHPLPAGDQNADVVIQTARAYEAYVSGE